MTVRELPIEILSFLGTMCMITGAFYMFSIVKIFEQRARKIYAAICIILFVADAYLCYGLHHIIIGFDREKSYFNKMIGLVEDMNDKALYISVALPVIAAVIVWISFKKHISTLPGPFSIQDGLDALPDGICIGNDAGTPLLVNNTMHRIVDSAFNTVVLDTHYLRDLLISGKVKRGCSISRRKEGEVYLFLTDRTIWDIRMNRLDAGKGLYWEYTAYDITELYNKSKVIKERNAHLKSVNERLKEYNRNLDSIAHDREVLAAKIRLHDDVGRALIAFRSYLVQEEGDRDKLISLWKQTVRILKNESRDEERKGSRIEALTDAAKAVDVTLHIEGEVPEAYEDIVIVALHECITNTVRHAGGTDIYVNIREGINSYSINVTNNGRQPSVTIREQGGLKNLRNMIELKGGNMNIISMPEFILIIELIKKDQ